MIRRTTDVGLAARQGFDAVIDVRSPGEFAQDHLPGAINLPVLDDAQRAVVGTEYVQGSKFRARRQGAALVARNIAEHLERALADRDGGFRPLVHCWRGGQRSGAMAAVMDQVGWTVTVLDGGYMTWRRAVTAALYDTPLAHRLVLLDGPTGAGKTEVLARLAARGVQTLDLEGLANHRGSLFGALPGGQPSQKLFESRLFDALEHLDPARPVVVEAESSRIGARVIPPALWTAMTAARWASSSTGRLMAPGMWSSANSAGLRTSMIASKPSRAAGDRSIVRRIKTPEPRPGLRRRDQSP